MTVTAFIMINIDGNNRKVLEEIMAIEETREAYMVFGPFDIIAKAEFKSHEELGRYVVEKIRSIEGVSDTQTNVCAAC